MKESKDKIVIDQETGLEYRLDGEGKKHLLLPKDIIEYKEKSLREESEQPQKE